MSGHSHGLKRAAAGIALVLAAAGTAVSTASAAPAAKASARVPALPKSGIWTIVSAGLKTQSPAPALWESPNGTGWDVFPVQLGPNSFTYDVVRLALLGGVTYGPKGIFPTHWGSLQFDPTLLGDGPVPVLVFSGLRGTPDKYNFGCVYGAVGTASLWALQSWSLSSDCLNPVGGAAENKFGSQLADAWPGGPGIEYRVGVSPTIPATPSPDQQIKLPSATAFPTAMANDIWGSGHFFVAWNQVFSKPASRDGVYVEDVTAPKLFKAPGSGTITVSNDFPIVARLAITNDGFHSGIFVAYCSNASTTCRLLLWRVGAAKPLAVPSSAGAFGVSIAQGPQGRIWVAWYNSTTNRMFYTRTNKADTRFGRVLSYATPCIEHGLLGLAGTPPTGRLQVGMSCVNAKAQAEQLVTQVRAGLSLFVPGPVHVPSTGLTIKIIVRDAGDPVQNATVKVDGKTVLTNSLGQATIHLPGGTKLGKYPVTATAPNYVGTAGTLTVK